MRRWYGNMLRNNGRAIALGPGPMGFFTWWCLLDQRVSMWTSLVGPGVVLLLSIAHQWSFIVGYLCWIMIVRLLVSVVLGLYRRRFSPLWPLLLYYNQVVGAFVKTHVSCRLNQQKWIRQNITAGEPTDVRHARRQRRMSSLLYAMQGATFILALAFYTKVLPVPAASSFRLITGNAAPAPDDGYWVAAALQGTAEGGTVHLPPGRFLLPREAITDVRAAVIQGAGQGRTTLVLGGAAPTAWAEALALPCDNGALGCRLDGSSRLLARDLTLLVVPNGDTPRTNDAPGRR